MASPQSSALKHWTRIIKQWPTDKVRPDTVSFQRIMQQRIQRSTQPSSTNSSPAAKGAVVGAPQIWNENAESRQANALYALLEDRFAKSNPMPESLRHPASNPTHYDDLVREMEEAPTRSWFEGVMKRIKGSLRFQ